MIETPTMKNLSIDDHILVKFEGKRSIKYYVGRILTLHSDTKEVETTFMRRLKTDKATNMIFTFQEEDACLHALEDVLLKLPVPTTGSTKRSSKQFRFFCPELQNFLLE